MGKEVPKVMNSENIFSQNSSFYIHLSRIPSSLEIHQHNFCEIDFVIEGSGTTRINGAEYSVTKGNVFFMKPADCHDYKADESSPLHIVNIAFPIVLIYSGILTFVPVDFTVFYLRDEEFASCKNVCNIALDKVRMMPSVADLFIKSCLEWLFLCITHSSTLVNPSKNFQNYDFAPALAYLHENFSSVNIGRNDVAKCMNMSPTYFSKFFHKAIGVTFQDYLLNIRLNHANVLIRTTKLSVLEVALASGFSSDSYFSKMYKKRFGIAPGKAR